MSRRSMAGAFLIGAVAFAATGCFHARPVTAHRAVGIWREDLARSRQARPRVGDRRSINLDQAIQIALRQSPELSRSRSAVAIAAAWVQRAAQLSNPELRLRDLRPTRLAQGELDMELALRIPLPSPWIRHARLQRERLSLARSEEAASAARRALSHLVRRGFLELTMWALKQGQLDDAVQLCKKQLTLLEGQARLGAVKDLDLARARSRCHELTDERRSCVDRKGEVVARLKETIGIPADRRVRFIAPGKLHRGSDLPAALGELNAHTLTARALQRRHDLRAAAAESEMARADLFMTRSGRWPWIRFLEVSTRVAPDRGSQILGVSMAVDVPIFSLGSGEVAEKMAGLARRRLLEKDLVYRVAHEVQRAVAAARQSASRLRWIEQRVLPEVKRSARILTAARSEGLLDPLEALSTMEQQLRTRQRHLQAWIAHQRALLSLEAASDG